MDKETKNWLAMVDYDLTTASSMFETGRYIYVIFLCHLAVEKMLKAIIVENTHRIPPRTHDLISLFKLSKATLRQELLDFLGMINNAAVVTRYPEELSHLIVGYPREEASRYLDRTKEVIGCLKNDPRLSRS